jgi:ABC-type antimicrobial peptide transport system permease subunit
MYFTYIRRELRRRGKQSIVVALGLAIGIALVVTVSSASAGVKSAQSQVLHSLYGVGTDMTVTKTATAGTGGPQHFTGPPSSSSSSGTGTTHFTRSTLHATPGETTLSETAVSKVSALDGVAAASGGLVLTDTAFSGSLPSTSTSTSTSTGSGSFTGTTPSSGASTSSGPPAGGPPSFDINSFTVHGVSIGTSSVGPLTASEVTTGSYFSATDATAKVAIVSKAYAAQKGLKVGSTLKVGSGSVKVIGIATLSDGAADVYVPLATAQKLSGLTGKITTIFVAASSASKVSSVASEVKTALPAATVSTSADLAKEVTGALSSASTLAQSLGRWLSIAALAVATLVAGLLMMAAVSRRVREFGTLKAIGWRTRRIVAQVMGEGVALGIAGGLLGLVLGIVASEAISAVAPSLSASVGNTTGGPGGFAGGQGFGAADTVLVHLTAPLQSKTFVIALLLAVAGGLVAGCFGAWRAARLRPADALRAVQ